MKTNRIHHQEEANIQEKKKGNLHTEMVSKKNEKNLQSVWRVVYLS